MRDAQSTNRHPICFPFSNLIRATLVRRENRFRVRVRIGTIEHAAYLPNPGRLQELLIPGRTVWLTSVENPTRKTGYNVTLMEHPDAWVSVNSHLPNRLVAAALRAGRISGFEQFHDVQSEVPRGNSRLDFLLSDERGQQCWVEVKSVTLVNRGVAQFPDAPTARGRRHLEELAAAVAEGRRAAVFFVVQRPDAVAFTPRDETDPAFGHRLREAAAAGVEIRAFCCNVTTTQICLNGEIPTSLDAPRG